MDPVEGSSGQAGRVRGSADTPEDGAGEVVDPLGLPQYDGKWPMSKKKAAGRQAAKETMRDRRRRKAKTKADNAPLPESPTSERNPGPTTDDRLAPQAHSLALSRGDLGSVCKTLKTGRIPLADEYREGIGVFLYDIMKDEEVPIRERIRAAQGLLMADRINVATEQAQDTPSIPPTITVVNDDRGYWEYRHRLIREQREIEDKTGGSND